MAALLPPELKTCWVFNLQLGDSQARPKLPSPIHMFTPLRLKNSKDRNLKISLHLKLRKKKRKSKKRDVLSCNNTWPAPELAHGSPALVTLGALTASPQLAAAQARVSCYLTFSFLLLKTEMSVPSHPAHVWSHQFQRGAESGGEVSPLCCLCVQTGFICIV